VVSYLGEMDAAGWVELKPGVAGQQQQGLFEDAEPEWVEVDVKGVKVDRKKSFGGAWLGLELCRRLGLEEFLKETMGAGREEIPWPAMALVLVIGRRAIRRASCIWRSIRSRRERSGSYSRWTTICCRTM
jgi:hypothetical protein